jgi:CRP/FNR family transcriptional regulator
MGPENNHFLRYLEALKESSFFGELETPTLKIILANMKAQKWKKGTNINSRDNTLKFYFIVNGRLKAYHLNPVTGREQTIFILNHGDVFDLLVLLDPTPHDIYWEAIDDIELLCANMEEARNWLVCYPSMHKGMWCYFGKSMRHLENMAMDISLHGTLFRLCHLLLSHINSDSHKLEVINDFSNDDIASLIGTTRAVVNRNIQELKQCGAISTGRKHLEVQDLDRLLEIMEEKYVP